MKWIRMVVAMALAAGAGCIPADSNIVGPGPDAGEVCTPACASGLRCVSGTCVGDGLLRFTLTWSQPGDVDLHVVTPAGPTINYLTRTGAGGTLDRDDRVGRGPENIFWTATPPLGEYLVCVIPFAITQPTNYVLDVRLPSGTLDRRAGTLTADPAATSASCSRTSPFFVASYTLTAAAADAGAADAATADAPAADAPASTDAPATEDAPASADVPATEDAPVSVDVVVDVDAGGLLDVAVVE